MEKQRCYGCMKLKSGKPVCEHCGYDETTPNEPHQLAAGTVLNEQYLIGKVLGQGGFGITYMGWDLYLDIPVAVKEYFPSGIVMRDNTVSMDIMSCSGDEGARFQNNKERFMREVKILARFSDVHEIVQVKNFFLANNTAYIVMEFVEGTTLKQYVKNKGGKLPVRETFRILSPVMEALCKVHKAGIVHRDISPDNIMMLSDGSAKLLDFGAVRDVGNAQIDKPLTKSTEAILKQGYAPIEQYQKRGNLGPWTDVYAFCATIYYCLTGQVPPDAPERLLGEEEISLRGQGVKITEEKEAVLKHGMALRSKDRIPGMEQLYRELFGEDPDNPDDPYDPEVEDLSGEQDALDGETDDEWETVDENTGTEVTDASHNEEENVKPGILDMTKKKICILAGTFVVCVVVVIAAVKFSCLKEGEAGRMAGAETKENVVSGQCGDDVQWELNRDNGTLTLSGTGAVWWYRVSEGGDDSFATTANIEEAGISEKWFTEKPDWFEYENEIKHLVVEDGITELSAALFVDMEHLETVELGTVERIWWGCFAGCISLTEIELPDTVEYVGSAAFRSCEKLDSVSIPNGSEAVGGQIFVGCKNLKTVNFGKDALLEDVDLRIDEENPEEYSEDVVYYGYTGSSAETNAKKYNIAFKSVGLVENPSGQCGENVTWVLDMDTKTLTLSGAGETYYYLGLSQDLSEEEYEEHLMADEIPESQLQEGRPGWYAYGGQIEHLVIEEGITTLTDWLFSDMESLQTADLGTVESIKDNCFLRCISLKEITIPESTTHIDGYAFNVCEGLEKVTILNGSEYIGEGVFQYCTNLKNVTFALEANPRNYDLLEEDSEEIPDVVYYVYENSYAYQNAIANGVAYKIIE